jgi:hypothetical protein
MRLSALSAHINPFGIPFTVENPLILGWGLFLANLYGLIGIGQASEI